MAKHKSREHANYQHHRRRESLQNASAFMTLIPPEIREIIYCHALVYPNPIELCPPKWVKEEELGTEAWETIVKLNNVNAEENYMVLRDQSPLVQARKNLAVGLLSTCRVVRREALAFFWSRNTFRFQADHEWATLRRFLGTAASSRHLIRRLEVYPSFGTLWTNNGPPLQSFRGHGLSRRIEMPPAIFDHPELGLEVLLVNGELSSERRKAENIQNVCALLAENKTLKDLVFIVAPACWFRYQRDVDDDVQPRLIPHELKGTRTSVVVERDGCIESFQDVENIRDEGWDVILQAGCFFGLYPVVSHDTGSLPIETHQEFPGHACSQSLLPTSDLYEDEETFSSIPDDENINCGFCFSRNREQEPCPWAQVNAGTPELSHIATDFPWSEWCEGMKIKERHRIWTDACSFCWHKNANKLRRIGFKTMSERDKLRFNSDLCWLKEGCECTVRYIHYLAFYDVENGPVKVPSRRLALALRPLLERSLVVEAS